MTPATAAPVRSSEVDLDALAAAARRVIGGDHAVIVLAGADEHAVVAGRDGLLASTLATIAHTRPDDVLDVLDREFGGATSAAAQFDGESYGSIHVVKHAKEGFDHAELLPVFAAQAGLALALAEQPAPPLPSPALLGELDDLVLRVDDLAGLTRALGRALGPLFGGARTGLMVVDAQSSTLQQLPGSFGAGGEVTASHRVSAYDLFSNSARVFTTEQPYLSHRCPGDAGIRQSYVDALGLRCLLSVPLRRVGVLHIADKAGGFTIDDVAQALALAPRIANIVALATTLLRQRRQGRLEEVLADVAVGIASGTTAGNFATPLQRLCDATDANLVAIVPEDGEPDIARLGPGNRTREQAVLDEADSEPGMRAYVVGPQVPGDPGWAAFYVPIRLGHQRVGTLAAFRNRGEPFNQSERRSFVRMANLAALARAGERYLHQRAELARAHERQRIADDLHDDVAQILFAAQLSLDAILQRSADLSDDVVAAIKRSRGLLIRGDTAIRTVIHQLSLPAPADIGARLTSAVAGVEDEFSLPVRVQIDDRAVLAAEDMPRAACDALVKVARESLVNAAKHAGPCRVVLSLKVSRRTGLVLTVADDGRGIAAAPEDGDHHHGLAALTRMMRDLRGALTRGESAGGGTKVTATLPLR